MDAMEDIMSRRSVRRYKKDPVPDDVVEEILKAAMNAPSAGNEQPWHFVVIKDKKLLEGISKIHPTATYTKDAALAILVCADKNMEKYPGFWVQDCSAAAENILLAATAEGLGSVWAGIYPLEDRVRDVGEFFDLPENIMPFCLIPMGYPAEEVPKVERYDTSRVHHDGW